MARVESDREDLFAEAVTLTRRVEGRLPETPLPVMIGIKSTGDSSFYFGPDRVYHYDADGRFRRAFVEGYLYRSQESFLTRLRRERSQAETALLRTEMTEDETGEFRSTMHEHLRRLQSAMDSETLAILRRHPADDFLLEAEFLTMIDRILSASPWLAPALVTRR